MTAYKKAFTKINLRKSDASSNVNIDVVPLMVKWQESARDIFTRITLNIETEISENIYDFVSSDEMFKMFEENKSVGELVSYAVSIKSK